MSGRTDKSTGSGIYQIQSKIKPERIYIGSAVHINLRWNIHLSNLRKNKHHSIKLQNHYNKYGESDLSFTVIEPCLIPFLITREQYYIDSMNPYFNICKIAGSALGVRYKHKKETVEKMRVRAMGNKFHLGFKHSDEAREKMRQSHLGIKLTMERREKMSKAHKGVKKKPFSEQHKINIGIASKNRIHKKGMHWNLSEETKKKIGDAQRGVKRSEETKMKIKASWAIRKLNNIKVA